MAQGKKGKKPYKRYRSPEDLETMEQQLGEYFAGAVNIPAQIKKQLQKDLDLALKARYKEKTDATFQPTEEEYEELPGALGIGITLDPREWQKEGVWEMVKKTGKEWVQSVFSWDDLSVMVEREEVWLPMMRGSNGFPANLAIFEKDPITGKWKAKGRGSLQTSLKKLGEDVVDWVSYSKSFSDRVPKFINVQEHWVDALFDAGIQHSGATAFLNNPAVQNLKSIRTRYATLKSQLGDQFNVGGYVTAQGLTNQVKEVEEALLKGDLSRLGEALSLNSQLADVKNEMDRLLWEMWREAQRVRKDLRGLISPDMEALFGLQDMLMFRENQHLFTELIKNIESKSVIRSYLWISTLARRYAPFMPAGIMQKVKYLTPGWWVAEGLKKVKHFGLSGTWNNNFGIKNFAYVEFRQAWDGLKKVRAEPFKAAWAILGFDKDGINTVKGIAHRKIGFANYYTFGPHRIANAGIRAQKINALLTTPPHLLRNMGPMFGLTQAEIDFFITQVIPELQRLKIPPAEWYNFLMAINAKSLNDLRMGFLTFVGRYLDALQKKLFAYLKRKFPWLLKGIKFWQGGFVTWTGAATSWMRVLATNLARQGFRTLPKVLLGIASAFAAFVATPVGSAIMAAIGAVASWIFEKTVKWVWKGVRGESDDSDTVRGCLIAGCGCLVFMVGFPIFIVVMVVGSAFFDYGPHGPAIGPSGPPASAYVQVAKSASITSVPNDTETPVTYTVTITANDDIANLTASDEITMHSALGSVSLGSFASPALPPALAKGDTFSFDYPFLVPANGSLNDSLVVNVLTLSVSTSAGDTVTTSGQASIMVGSPPAGLPPTLPPVAGGVCPPLGEYGAPRETCTAFGICTPYAHQGVDVAVPYKTPVKSPFPGEATVADLGSTRQGGIYVTLKSGEYEVTFRHLESNAVKKGDTVYPGQAVAFVNNTGTNTTGNHLHFEVRYKGSLVDPCSVGVDTPCCP
ncbi:MAG: peptidoglycan DD-metalloendopeptidase family protein [bacterium]